MEGPTLKDEEAVEQLGRNISGLTLKVRSSAPGTGILGAAEQEDRDSSGATGRKKTSWSGTTG